MKTFNHIYFDLKQFKSQLLSGIADNIWNAGVVLDPTAQTWRLDDLGSARGTRIKNGEVVGEGYGRDVMGHPFDALVWLANTLATYGKSLIKDMIVITGSVVGMQFVNSQDNLCFTLDGFGDVTCSIA